jgi:hypothetical protein
MEYFEDKDLSLLINPDYRGRRNWAKKGVL